MMNRKEFMRQLELLLSDISEDERRKRWIIMKAILTRLEKQKRRR